MALRRFTKTLSVAMALLAWLCLGLVLPIVMSFYSDDISTDIVEASARALLQALNKTSHAERLETSSLNSVYLWGV